MPCSHPIVNATTRGTGCCRTTNAIQQWIISRNPNSFTNSGCFVVKNIAGTNRTLSVHATGRAGDVGIVPPIRNGIGPTTAQRQQQMIWIIDRFLIPAACTLGIQRMIFKRKIWESRENPIPWSSWRTFNGAQSHDDHLHFEITPGTCRTFDLNDVSQVMRSIDQPVSPPPIPAAPTPPPSTGSTSGSIVSTATNTGSGNSNISTGADQRSTPTSAADTAPVWSPTEAGNTPCEMCGPPWNALVTVLNNEDDRPVTGLMYTHCGGTGGTCVEMSTGRTCSVGTAPQLGNFPGPIIDFIYWGNGAYGLSADGMNVWNLGTAAPATFVLSPGVSPPWEQLFVVNPTTLGVSASTGPLGFRSARARVNSIANHTCC
jgi:hypothetical protein